MISTCMKFSITAQAFLSGLIFTSSSDAIHVPRATLEKCPSGERSTYLIKNRIYNICPGTDYWSPNIQVIPKIANVDACVAQCSDVEGCAKASYNKKQKTCYLKGDPVAPTWFDTPDLDTIRVANVPECPGTERIVDVKGGKFTICPGTDYWSPNVRTVTKVANVNACVSQCAKDTSTCQMASYNPKLKTCYLKGKPSNPVWFADSNLDTLRFVKNQNPVPSAAPTPSSVPTPSSAPSTVPNPVGNHSGKWGKVFSLPVIPVAGYVVPEWPESNRLFFWSAWATNKFSLWSPPNGYTQFADYNYKTGAVSRRTVSNTGHDMFCPGISSLADGRVVVSGGTNAEVTSIYDPATNQFTRGPDMKIPRGYQTSATLSNGKVFTIGGSFSGEIGGKTGEIFDPQTNSWTVLPGAKVEPLLTSYDWEGEWRTDNHAWLFPWKDGSVLQAGPSKGMHWYGTTGSGSVQDAGIRDSKADAMCGIHVMFDIGKIFSAGGSQSYTASPATSRAHLITITEAFKAPTVELLPNMNDPRGFANVVVLPNGQVLVIGGQRVSRVFQDEESVLTPELFDPATKTFKRLAPMTEPRNYHAIALLLGDGRVFTGGGGMCGNLAPGDSEKHCDRAIDHQNGQIFTPPYLLNNDGSLATRPVISAVASEENAEGRSVKVGGSITVQMNSSGDHTFSLVRMGSVTHSINSDQRRVPLSDVEKNDAAFTMKLPDDSGILIPGFYYLFAINASGVPSVARTLQVML